MVFNAHFVCGQCVGSSKTVEFDFMTNFVFPGRERNPAPGVAFLRPVPPGVQGDVHLGHTGARNPHTAGGQIPAGAVQRVQVAGPDAQNRAESRGLVRVSDWFLPGGGVTGQKALQQRDL